MNIRSALIIVLTCPALVFCAEAENVPNFNLAATTTDAGNADASTADTNSPPSQRDATTSSTSFEPPDSGESEEALVSASEMTCTAPLKPCGGLCVQPTPRLGCSSAVCSPCPEPENGSAICAQGECAVACDEGYSAMGDRCEPVEDCNDDSAAQGADCGEGGKAEACLTTADCMSDWCGVVGDGCGGSIDCGACPTGQTCTSSGTCCTPLAPADCSRECGRTSDGCGGTVNCGRCPEGETCLRNGTCCAPLTVADCGGSCGWIDDGCGGEVDCRSTCSDAGEPEDAGQACEGGSASCTP